MGENKKKSISKRWLVILILVLCVGAIGGFMINKKMNDNKQVSDTTTNKVDKPKKSDEKEVKIKVIAKDLIKAYQDNQSDADSLYKDKDIQITGIVADIGTAEGDRPFITIGNGADIQLTKVQCFFKDSENDKLKSLKSGDEITVIGKCDGKVVNIVVNDCVIK